MPLLLLGANSKYLATRTIEHARLRRLSSRTYGARPRPRASPGLHQQGARPDPMGSRFWTAPAQVLILPCSAGSTPCCAQYTASMVEQNLLPPQKGLLVKEPAAHRLYALDVLPVAERRQDNDTLWRPGRQNLSGHAHAVQQRHLDVQQRHVRADARQPSTASIPSQASPTTRYPGGPSKSAQRYGERPHRHQPGKWWSCPSWSHPSPVLPFFTKRAS